MGKLRPNVVAMRLTGMAAFNIGIGIAWGLWVNIGLGTIGLVTAIHAWLHHE